MPRNELTVGAAFKTPRHFLQQRVASRMAEKIVHVLETINVNGQDSYLLTFRACEFY